MINELDKNEVSIHAPAWGATRQQSSILGYPLQVSIHAPAWGATHPAFITVPLTAFQSTLPRGERQ